MLSPEYVILVDENDQPLGQAEKLAAHREGLCHRAFSIFILDHQKEPRILLQQRAAHKYHSPNLWTNTCCSHPRPGENLVEAGQRRLFEEMRINTALDTLGHFHYIARFDNGLIENEVDHVLVGYSDEGVIHPDPNEVQAYRWVSFTDVQHELNARPAMFTPWFKPALELLFQSVR